MASGDFFSVVQQRRSIRKFAPQPVTVEQLRHILEAALVAPSAGNLQAYHVVVVKETTMRQRLARVTANPCAAEAPQLLCVQDATIACAYAQLAASALGSVWLGATCRTSCAKSKRRAAAIPAADPSTSRSPPVCRGGSPAAGARACAGGIERRPRPASSPPS